ncbi:hypothetical protein Tco_1134841 [Tanacetum coccineum]
MAEQPENQQQQQQQDRPDEELVPVDEHVQIGPSNYRIALERPQPNVIYKFFLAILHQYFFYNAFIRIADALEMYMQQFWHTVTYDLIARTYFFTLDDRIFEVNADLLREALQVTPKYSDHPSVQPPPHDDIFSFINKIGHSEPLTKVSNMDINNMYQP